MSHRIPRRVVAAALAVAAGAVLGGGAPVAVRPTHSVLALGPCYPSPPNPPNYPPGCGQGASAPGRS